MNAFDIAWPMLAAVSLTLGLIHGTSWAKERQHVEQLAVALTCVAIAAATLGELFMMRATTPERYGVVLRFTQVCITLICIGIVWFVHARYRPGRAWLAALVIATRVGCMIPNFFAGANVNFSVIHSLDFVSFASSGPLAIPNGEASPWMTLVGINGLLLVAYLVNALVVVSRRGDAAEWRDALITCGGLLVFVVVGSLWNRAIVSGWLRAPMVLSPAFIGTMLAMTYDAGSAMRERRRAERELAVHREELAHLSRVAVLAELSGSLSHELSQPLTAILANAQAALLFLDRSPPEVGEVRESLREIVENDKRAHEVIQRLRAMLRKERTEKTALDINEVVRDALRLARTDLSHRHVESRLALAPDLPAVHGDRVQLQQVLLNLILNAVEAMGGSGGLLRIGTRCVDRRDIDVVVTDNGRGIAKADLGRIFSPFVTTKTDGMGLGLAVCASIVRSHGGAMWAENNSDHGAAVTFRLPVAGSMREATPPG
jgi:signal transduction histidine kinase